MSSIQTLKSPIFGKAIPFGRLQEFLVTLPDHSTLSIGTVSAGINAPYCVKRWPSRSFLLNAYTKACQGESPAFRPVVR